MSGVDNADGRKGKGKKECSYDCMCREGAEKAVPLVIKRLGHSFFRDCKDLAGILASGIIWMVRC